MSWVLLVLYTALQDYLSNFYFLWSTIKLWNLDANTNAHTFEGHNNCVNAIAFSPDGKYLASGSSDKYFAIYNWSQNPQNIKKK